MPSSPVLIKTVKLSLLVLLLSACGGGGGGSSDSSSDSQIGADEISQPSPAPSDEESDDNVLGFASSIQGTTEFGPTESCPYGGINVYSGIDTNQDGLLNSSEINDTQALCHGNTANIIAISEDLLPGTACLYGGTALTLGYDFNNSEALESDEISQRLYVCQRPAVTNLTVVLTAQTDEPEGENCPWGGVRNSIGADINQNGVLDDDEISRSDFQCNINYGLSDDDDSVFSCHTHYSGYHNCEGSTSYARLKAGVDEQISLATLYDDANGKVTFTSESQLPTWLSLELIELTHSDYPYIPEGVRKLSLVTNSASIPRSEGGNEYSFLFTFSDGTNTFNYDVNIRVFAPISVTIDKTSISFTEDSSVPEQLKTLLVTFDPPLPASITSSNNSRRGLSMSESDSPGVPRSTNDISYEWANDFFFEGQTEATVLVRMFDDSFPEDTELSRLNIKLGYQNYADNMMVFLPASTLIEVVDDADQAITGNISFDNVAIEEGSDPQNPVSVGFTIQFSSPIPEDDILYLRLVGADGSSTSDVCFSVSSYSCPSYQSYRLRKGDTSVDGQISIYPDMAKEIDEEVVVKINSVLNFELELNDHALTILDDDPQPELTFSDQLRSIQNNATVIKVGVSFSAPTIDEVLFSLEPQASSTAVEGVDYFFGISQPVRVPSGVTEVQVPIITTGNDFPVDDIKLDLKINSQSGALASTQTMSVIIDKIAPYSLDTSDLYLSVDGVDVSIGTYSPSLYIESTKVDQQGGIYVVGRASGQLDDDLLSSYTEGPFVAKYSLERELLWVRQLLGSGGYFDRADFSENRGQFVFTNSNTVVSVSSSGVIASTTIPNASNYEKIKVDDNGNVFLARRDIYSDLDADTKLGPISVVKLDSDLNIVWAEDDFSSLGFDTVNQVFVSNWDLILDNSGNPFVVISSDDLSSSGLGTLSKPSGLYEEDLAVFAYSSANGTITGSKVFGGDIRNYNFKALPNGTSGIVVFFFANQGTYVEGIAEAVAENTKIASTFDTSASMVTTSLDSSISASLNQIHTLNDQYLFWSTGYGEKPSILNSNFDIVRAFEKDPRHSNQISGELVNSSDGGYYVVYRNDKIYKVSPSFDYRGE